MVLKSRSGFTLSLVSGGSFLKKEELKAHISWKRFGKCDKKKNDSSLINLFSKVESVESYTLKRFYRQTHAKIWKHSTSYLGVLSVLYLAEFSTGAMNSASFSI